MWKSTWTYTKDVYHMDEELGAQIEMPTLARPSVPEAEALEDFEGGLDMAEQRTTRDLDPFAEDFVDPEPVEVEDFDWWMYDGEVQDARELVQQIDWGPNTVEEHQWNEALDELENPGCVFRRNGSYGRSWSGRGTGSPGSFGRRSRNRF